MPLTAVRALMKQDMADVDQLIKDSLHSHIPLISEISHYIVNSGGKRLRPLLTLLAARACGYEEKTHVHLAVIIEFIHTATLLHDDVVDMSHLRRGRQTANDRWGNSHSILVGDFLYSRSFQLMVALQSMPIMALMANTTNTISEGEVLQLLNMEQPNHSQENYMEMLRCKTAILFQAACQMGALIQQSPPPICEAMSTYGLHLGLAYQLVDDVLDYQSNAENMGKDPGDDFAEGKLTLPLIYALETCSNKEKSFIEQALKTKGCEDFSSVQEIIQTTQALERTRALANTHIQHAKASLDVLPASDYRDAMLSLLSFTLERNR